VDQKKRREKKSRMENKQPRSLVSSRVHDDSNLKLSPQLSVSPCIDFVQKKAQKTNLLTCLFELKMKIIMKRKARRAVFIAMHEKKFSFELMDVIEFF
jgi:hypothetical protein